MTGSSFKYLVKEGTTNIWFNRLMSFASIGVLCTCLLLVGFAMVFSMNVSNMVSYIETQNEAVVFVEDKANEQQTEELKQRLEKNTNIFDIRYVSKQQALEEQMESIGDTSLLEGLDEDDFMPATFRIRIKDPEIMVDTVKEIENYDNVMNFVRIINHPKGLAIGARHITISTCGLCEKIRDYAHEGIQTNLAISLHAPNDEIRNELMPINKKYPMDELREAIKYYIEKTNRRVTLEYILLKGVNDDIKYARQLAHYLRGLNVYVNLIPYNAVDEHGYQQSLKKDMQIFKDELLRLKINTTQRKEHGRDIDGACGQLRAKKVGEKS